MLTKPPPALRAAVAWIDAQRGGWATALTWPEQAAQSFAKRARGAKGVTLKTLAAAIAWKLAARERAVVRERVKRAPERAAAKRVAKRRVAVSVPTPAGVRLNGRPGYVTLRVSLPVATFDALIAVAQRRRVTSEMVAAQLIAELCDA